MKIIKEVHCHCVLYKYYYSMYPCAIKILGGIYKQGTCTCIIMYIHNVEGAYIPAHTYTESPLFRHAHIHIRDVHRHMHIYTHKNTYTTNTHTHTHIHTHTHTTHTHTRGRSRIKGRGVRFRVHYVQSTCSNYGRIIMLPSCQCSQ